MGKNRHLKSTAIILIIALLTLLLSPVSATTEAVTRTTETINQLQQPFASETLTGIELTERREENVKHYLLENGLYEAVVFPVPVHYQDDTGAFVSIDNNLDLITENDQSYYENRASPVRVRLAQTVQPRTDDWLMELAYQDSTVRWRLSAEQSSVNGEAPDQSRQAAVSAQVETGEMRRSADEQQGLVQTSKDQRSDMSDLYSTAMYPGLLPGCDIAYAVTPVGVKESIIINSPVSQLSIAMYMEFAGLTPLLREDGSIDLYDETGQVVLQIPRPNLLDQSDEYDYSVRTELTAVSDHGWLLRYTPDPAYLKTAQYPVILDPWLQTSSVRSDIRDASVFINYPNTNYQNETILYIGKGSTRGVARIFLKFNNLPTLTASQRVHYAELELYKRAVTTNVCMTAHRVLGSWDSSTITWANKPNYDTTVAEYSNQTSAGDKYLDITTIAQDWLHDGVNNGLMLKSVVENYVAFTYWSSDSTAGEPPVVRFQYSDYAGLEDYWHFHGSTGDRGASVRVNTFNGNLVAVAPLIQTSGLLLPVSLGLVFNSTSRAANPADIQAGLGWRTTYDQKIEPISLYGISYYRYTDGDGTEHFFYNSGSQWQDEDGLGLTYNPSTYTITDKQGGELVFYNPATGTYKGKLRQIKDANGNTVQINQTTYGTVGCVTSIVDAAGRTVTLSRTTGGQLQSVTDPAGRTTSLTYSSARLTTVTYPDGKTAQLSYLANGNLSGLTDAGGVKTSITYQSSAPYRVTGLAESNAAGTVPGGTLAFAYTRNKTTVTNHLGQVTTYQFNSRGDCLCVIGPDDAAGYAGYNDGGRLTHTASEVSRPQKFVPNLLKNHSTELSADWSFSAANGTAGYATDKAWLGARSIKLYKTSATGQNTATQTITLTKGKTYTLSAWLSTSNVGTTGRGAGLNIAYESSSGVFTTIAGRSVRGSQDFIQETLTFTVPTGAYSGTVRIQPILEGTTGTAWFDALALEEGQAANRYNSVLNSDFDDISGSLPLNWTRSAACTSSDIIISSASSGKPASQSLNRLQITGSMTDVKYVEQTLPLSGAAGDVYVFGAWAKGTSVPVNAGKQAVFAVQLGFINGTSETWKSLAFNEDSTYWQYLSGAAVATGAYTSVKIRLNYSYNANSAEFDGVQLYKEVFGSTYTYDPNGNIISSNSSDGTTSGATYNTANDVTGLTLPNGQNYTYTYDTKHNPLTATSATSVLLTMTYDSKGNVTSVREGDSTTHVKSTAAYTANGNYLAQLTDPFGQTVSYSHDNNKGTLNNLTLPNGQVIQYAWNSQNDNLTGVSAVVGGQTITNSYTYNGNGWLSGIAHTAAGGTVSYSFLYNELGWRTTTRVGAQNLLTTVYEQAGGRYTGKVLRHEYGNGQTVAYDYDSLQRVTGVRLNTVLRYVYGYDANGDLCYIKDARDGSVVWTVRDLAGRLSEIRNSDGTSSRFTYNGSGQMTQLTENLAGTTYTTAYAYDADYRPTTATWQGSYQVDTAYHATLDRVSSITRKVSGVTRLTTTLGYAPGAAGISTASKRIASLTNTGRSAISYAYDVNGNISVITQGTDRIEYYYDGLSQLKRENYSVGSTSYTRVYTYDTGGNIQSIQNHPYTMGNGTLGTPLSTDTYTYDTTWRDKLTAYNGQSISYDTIGNPTSYLGATLTWTMGRQLESYAKAGTSIQYTYNESGLRTSKVVNGTATAYHLVGDQVTMEQTGTQTPIRYAYDAAGQLFLIQYDGQNYFYAKNAQGDIIGMVDANGSWVVEYKYDAWGKLLSTTGTLANTLGIANPYRYRGYRYDSETGLYYLQSRYYDSMTGRFINADSVVAEIGNVQGYNLFAYCNNNPVMFDDPNGYWPKLSTILTIVAVAAVVVAAVAVVVATCGAAAPAMALAGGGIIGSLSTGAIATATTVATIATVTAVAATTAAVVTSKVEKPNNTVYKLVDPASNETKYVGRTTNETARRNAHASDPEKVGLRFEPIARDLNYVQARGLEQIAMLEYNTKSALNRINGVSPKNRNLGTYMSAGRDVAHYIGNQISNEILYWTGN